MRRERISVLPPGAKGTTMVMGRAGWARAGAAREAARPPSSRRREARVMDCPLFSGAARGGPGARLPPETPQPPRRRRLSASLPEPPAQRYRRPATRLAMLSVAAAFLLGRLGLYVGRSRSLLTFPEADITSFGSAGRDGGQQSF